MDALFLVKNRKSVTTFNKKEIPADVLSEILNCARVTPTRNYYQEWKFVVIREPSTKDKISELSGFPFFSKANVVVAVFSQENKFKLEYTSAATEAMLIAASYYNIGVCWQATYNEPYAKQISTYLNAPATMHLMGLVALGYYDFTTPSFHNVPPLSEMLVKETFK